MALRVDYPAEYEACAARIRRKLDAWQHTGYQEPATATPWTWGDPEYVAAWRKARALAKEEKREAQLERVMRHRHLILADGGFMPALRNLRALIRAVGQRTPHNGDAQWL